MTNEIRLDCKMCGLKMYDTKTTEVWFVLDDDEDSGMPNLWRTKMDAEIYARRMYPDESPDRRYALIYSEKIMSYDQQYCADELEEPNELS